MDNSDISSGAEFSQYYSDIGDWQSGDLDYFTIDQNWQNYTEDEHKMWRHLFEKQQEIVKGRAIDMFNDSLSTLGINEHQIPKLEEVNEILMKRTGWQVVGVPGLIPGVPFNELLANRRFPAGTFIRTPKNMDYIQEPDIFHDLFGHVPLLADPVFADYMQAFGEGSMKAKTLDAEEYLGRLYWFTVEFGLIEEKDGLKIYGAGILSSPTESVFSLESPSPHRIRYNPKRIMRTHAHIDDFQENYFVIDSFQQLYDSTVEPDFAPLYEEVKQLPTILPGETIPEDNFINKGTREYEVIANEKRKNKTIYNEAES